MTDARAPRIGFWTRMKPRAGRGDATPLAMWFWDIDRVLLLIALCLIAIGLIAVAAASPASAARYSGDHHHIAPLYYFWRQLAWVAISLPVMFVVSMLPVQTAKRLALVGCAVCVALLAAVPFVGAEVNGARRWFSVGFGQFQPSEFLKPFFIVTIAWLLSIRAREKDLPVLPLTLLLTAGIGFLLMLEPDFGQTIIFGAVWLALLMVAGMPMRLLGALIGCVPVGLVAAYVFYDTARTRIDAFLFRGADPNQMMDHYQTDMAHATLTGGGLFGTGPGGGIMKFRLPEAHTDYIFSVIGEEFGLISCVIVALLFVALIARVFVKLLDEQDEFRLLAGAGLAIQFGTQATINMLVNTGMAPSKGMTLPFVSYGGSSMIALSIGMGLLLAFTRRNPFLTRSPYSVRWSGA
ncbi:putative lipid II flippase FtsW [Hephaestia sp. GCM10023244]|uniref:putative lipid II flippase FtsW n=1 Tax=unclassified Hephaestia TaxID=2631281 RepID=UPI0020776424|nr:putative lipid II flippase FtsW [Hephaestia sp. MAHUQ-44]MCM8730712.1 putative lipid II flippase FtsW [Hephaestia sp. MAHUQ-44]